MSNFYSDGQHTPQRLLAPRLPNMHGRQPSPPVLNASERRRVRRACIECRTKKVKCNGSEPCARCTSFRIQCEYGDFAPRSNIGMADASQVEGLETRMTSMEQMLRLFLEQFQGIQARNSVRTTRPPPEQATAVPADAVTAGQHKADDPRSSELNHTDRNMQQLLDAVEADAAETTRRQSSLSPTYTDSQHDEHGHEHEHEQENDGDTILVADDSLGETAYAVDGEEPSRDDPSDAADPAEADAAEESGHRYADGLGELDVDPYGQLRYVGLGSTVSILENCIGLRRHINKRLVKKGYNSEEPFLVSPGATDLDTSAAGPATGATVGTGDGADPATAPTPRCIGADEDKLPPVALVEQLIGIYVHDLAFLFPIITAAEIQHIYGRLLSQPRVADRDPGYAAVFFALLAVAAPLLPADVAGAAAWPQKPQQLGATFYNTAMHYVNTPFHGKHERKGRSQDVVVALGLLSMYLSETGSQAEAWIAVGRAIRNAQDLGLHRSPERLHLPMAERNQRRYIWWCLYILERQLCTALGRPLCVDDQDCDTEVPVVVVLDGSGEGTDNGADDGDVALAGFAAMVHLYRIIGQILKIVNSVRNAEAWRRLVNDEAKRDELRARVREANESLQTWAADMVPAAVKSARSGKLLATKHIALSSFFAAVMLLHRLFMSTPHRPSPLAESQAQRKSAAAATDCIRETTGFLNSVPPSHYVVFHGQYVFMSAIVLMHSVRCSDDAKFTFTALKDVELATTALHRLESFWKGARKSRATVDEYLDFTFHVLQGNRKGQCLFRCEHNKAPCPPTHYTTPSKRAASSSTLAPAAKARPPKRLCPSQATVSEASPASARSQAPPSAMLPPPASPPSVRHPLPPRLTRPQQTQHMTPCTAALPPVPPTPPSSLHSQDIPPPILPAPPTEHAPVPIAVPPSLPSMPPMPLDGAQPPLDTHFDDTIGNFLGAISPSFHLCEPYFDGFTDVDFHHTGVNFVSPDGNELQNFFF